MGNPAGVRRDFAALERRRMEAARLLGEGLSQSEVARELGVHRQSVSRWARELEQSGVRALRKAQRTGRPPKLSPVQLRDLERALKRGPEVCGYVSGLWTAARVRDLIAERTGVRYHEARFPPLFHSRGARRKHDRNAKLTGREEASQTASLPRARRRFQNHVAWHKHFSSC